MNNKLTATLASLLAAAGMYAAQPSDFTIYINPGHGGHDSDDRNVVIEPFTQGDPKGFWESNSNLDKGLMLRDLLKAKGFNVVMSRVTNTTADDLGLTTIGRLANESKADIFLSIHSNATGIAARRNFPLMLFRGYDNEPVIPASKEWATVANKHLLDNQATWWTSTALNVRGDWTFYPSWGKQGLGVLRALTVTGMLSEGSFHDYIPETYRLMNMDFKWLEAWHFMKAMEEYLGLPGDTYGAIYGRLNDTRLLRQGDFLKFGDDQLDVVQGATVTLTDASGKVVETCTTDDMRNGIYGFRHVEPGNYHISISCPTHEPYEADINVVANAVSYGNYKLKKIRDTPPAVINYSPVWKEGDEGVLCNSPVMLTFNWDMDTESVEKAFSIEPAAEGTFTWSEQNTKVVFTPSAPYSTSTLYTVTVSTDAQHGGGTPMTEPFKLQFTTNDRDFMNILSQYPGDGDMVHYQGAAIEVRVDKVPNIASAGGALMVVDSKGNTVSTNRRKATYSKKGDAYGYFRIPFSTDLTVGETYTLTIDASMKDTDGISLQEGTSVTFQAVDAGDAKTTPVINPADKAANYTIDEENSTNYTTATATDDNDCLQAPNAVKFAYAFASDDNAEILWEWADAAADKTAVTSADAIGIHIRGDLTENEVYLQFTSESDIKYLSVGKMNYLGWRYIEVPAATFEGEKDYFLTGVKVAQVPSQMSAKGDFSINNIQMLKNGTGGVTDITADQMTSITVHPNPASDYLVANADGLIESVELISQSGQLVAATSGNVLNVSEITPGVYMARITTTNAIVVRKVIISHNL